jgi:hypothetical protein
MTPHEARSRRKNLVANILAGTASCWWTVVYIHHHLGEEEDAVAKDNNDDWDKKPLSVCFPLPSPQ